MARSGNTDEARPPRGRKTKRDQGQETVQAAGEAAPNPVWFKPIMLGLMLVGLVWILVFYLSGTEFPIPGIEGWNLLIGFGIAFAGFLMTTRWR
jgi:hypothetical protein